MFLGTVGKGHDYWFNNSSNKAKVENALKNAKSGARCIISLGINDYTYTTSKYPVTINNLATSYPNVIFEFYSVTAVNENKNTDGVTNADITNFNNAISSNLRNQSRYNKNLFYTNIQNKNVTIGGVTKPLNKWITDSTSYMQDGVHYSNTLSKEIFNQTMIQGEHSSATGSSRAPISSQKFTKTKDELNNKSISMQVGDILEISGTENFFGSYSYLGGSVIKEIKLDSSEFIDYSVNGDKSILTIKAKKAGNTKLELKSTTFSGFGATSATITDFKVIIEVKNTNAQIENLTERQNYVNEYLKNITLGDLTETPTPQEILHAILNDKDNGYENLRNKDLTSLKKYQDIVNEHVQNERREIPDYREVKSVLNALVEEKENGGDGRTAISANQAALDQAAGRHEQYLNNESEAIEQALTRLRHELQSFSMGTRQSAGPFYDVLGSDTDVYTPNNVTGSPRATQEINKVLSYVTTVGMIISVLSLVVMGVKFMLASVEERADYKGALIPYVIGACLLFGICSIVKILEEFGNKINGII